MSQPPVSDAAPSVDEKKIDEIVQRFVERTHGKPPENSIVHREGRLPEREPTIFASATAVQPD